MDFEWNQIKISIAQFFNNYLVSPVKRWWLAILAFFKNLSFSQSPDDALDNVVASDSDEPVTDEKWKEAALDEFKTWLAELPETESQVKNVTPDTCDLYTMLSEFIALRQEIKMQNREQHRTVAALNSVKSVTDQYDQIFKIFKERTHQLSQLEENIRLNSEKKAVTHFFDLRDSLVRGHKASVEIANKRGFFTRPPKGIEKISEGYEMAISRFDKAISMMDVEPVETYQAQFNPNTMKAIETRTVNIGEDGVVLETVSGGFVRGKEVMRHAQVVVSHVPQPITHPEPDLQLEAPEKSEEQLDQNRDGQERLN